VTGAREHGALLRALRRPGGVAVENAAVDEADAGTRYAGIVETRTKLPTFARTTPLLSVTSKRAASGILARPMQAASPSSFEPAGAGGLLLAVLVLCVGAGVLIGWLAGSAGIGALLGSVVGILGGIFSVYRRYRGVI
jgi:hypothetical protein